MVEKLKKYSLVLLCFAYLFLRGRANKVKKPERIVVIQMAKLGDMVCTTPVFRAIKKQFPSSFLAVVGNSVNKDILEGNADVDRYIIFESVRSIRCALAEGRFDTAVVVGPDMVSAGIAYLAGIPCVIVPRIIGGTSPFEALSYRLLRSVTGMIVVDHQMGKYAPREYLRTLEPLKIFSNDTTKRLAYSSSAEKEILGFLDANLIKKDGPNICISPSAGNKIKNWGGEKFARLAECLWKEYSANIIVIGSSRDRKEVNEMLRSISPGIPLINASEKFSIDRLKALISRADLFVSVDTGPIYIAEAFDVPTVDIVGPMDEREQPPIGISHAVVLPPGPRKPELHITNARGYDRKEARRQTESITVSMVMDACRLLLAPRRYKIER